MLNSDITYVISYSIQKLIGADWRHEVALFGESDRHLNFEIDGKEYVLVLHEVKDGHHWYEFLHENSEEERTQNDQP